MNKPKRYSAIVQGQKVTITDEELEYYRARLPIRTDSTHVQRPVQLHRHDSEANMQIKAFYCALFLFVGVFVLGMYMQAVQQDLAIRYHQEVQNGR